MNKNWNEEFMREISKCKDPIIFLGLATTLMVPIYEDEDEKIARDFTSLFADVMARYSAAPHKLRKDLYKMLREANKNGYNS